MNCLESIIRGGKISYTTYGLGEYITSNKELVNEQEGEIILYALWDCVCDGTYYNIVTETVYNISNVGYQ